MCCLFTGDVYIFSGISIEFLFVCESVFELIPDVVLVILLSSHHLATAFDLASTKTIFIPIKSPVEFAVF